MSHKFYNGLATSPFNFPAPREVVEQLEKALDKEPELEYFKSTKVGFEHFIDGERADVSVITDNSLDEEHEIVDIKTLDWSSFQKNPIVAFQHNYNIPPIGRSLWQKLVGDKWKAKTQYASRPGDHPKDKEWFPDSIYHLVKSGFLPGKSIGGVGKVRKPTEAELVLYPTLKAVRYDGKVFEYSVVQRQANNNAIVEAVSKGLIQLSESTLEAAFPEIASIIKDLTKPIVIEGFVTEEDYLKALELKTNLAIEEVQNKTPELVEDCLARLMGRV